MFTYEEGMWILSKQGAEVAKVNFNGDIFLLEKKEWLEVLPVKDAKDWEDNQMLILALIVLEKVYTHEDYMENLPPQLSVTLIEGNVVYSDIPFNEDGFPLAEDNDYCCSSSNTREHIDNEI